MKESIQSKPTEQNEYEPAKLHSKSPKKIAKWRKQFLSRAFFKLELLSSKSKPCQ